MTEDNPLVKLDETAMARLKAKSIQLLKDVQKKRVDKTGVKTPLIDLWHEAAHNFHKKELRK